MPGVLVGFVFACEAREKNRVNFCLEIASAITLWRPGTWFKRTWKLFLAAVRNSSRRRDIILGWREVLPSHAWTIGKLSRKNRIRLVARK